ncbi:DciA family protein [Kitasatospora sp. NPDC058162]|uniref:DciA family protein n=1 Tax=Kitasatospora sp. NPDC058162 TaxID=3346362 RepID=UPI0036DD89D1
MTSTSAQAPSGADLARTALRAARRAASLNGNAPAKKKPAPTRQQIARAGRDSREPSALAAVVPAMATAQGWALGAAQGTMRSNWAQLVGPEEASHWFPAGFNASTRTLRITCDSPAWATKLRLEQPAVLAQLNGSRPGTVRALDIRVGPATPVGVRDAGQEPVPARPHAGAAWAPNGLPVDENPLYQQLRQQMRDQSVVRQPVLEEAAAERDAAREKWFRGHRGWCRKPEGPAADADQPEQAVARAHDREQLARHRAALAAARATRAGATPLRTARPAPPKTGAA